MAQMKIDNGDVMDHCQRLQALIEEALLQMTEEALEAGGMMKTVTVIDLDSVLDFNQIDPLSHPPLQKRPQTGALQCVPLHRHHPQRKKTLEWQEVAQYVEDLGSTPQMSHSLQGLVLLIWKKSGRLVAVSNLHQSARKDQDIHLERSPSMDVLRRIPVAIRMPQLQLRMNLRIGELCLERRQDQPLRPEAVFL